MKTDPAKLRAWQERSAKKAMEKRKQKKFTQKQWNRGMPMKRTPLKKVSKSRAREMRLYYEERTEWLKLPQNSACAVCLCLGETPMAATECHHKNGRAKGLLRYQPFWIPTCRTHRETPHKNIKWAREVGLIGEPAEWNVFPRDAVKP